MPDDAPGVQPIDPSGLPGVPDAFQRLWTPHRMAYLTGDAHSADASDHIRMDWKPVVTTHYQPMERKY